MKKILLSLLGAGIFTAVKVIKDKVECRKFSRIYEDHICPECSLQTLEEVPGGEYLICRNPECSFFTEYRYTDIRDWEEDEAQEQHDAELKKEDNLYLEDFKQSKFAETYRGYLLDLLDKASYYIGDKKATDIFLDDVVTYKIHQNLLIPVEEVNEKLHSMSANEIYNYMTESGIDPNNLEGILSHELDMAFKEYGISFVSKMDFIPLVQLKEASPENHIYKLVHHYDNDLDENPIFLSVPINSPEIMVYTLGSLLFKFEDLIDESIYVEPAHIVKLLQKYYDAVNVTGQCQVFIPYTNLDRSRWDIVNNFAIGIHEEEIITISQIDLYYARESCCGLPELDKMMKHYLPKHEDFEKDILELKREYNHLQIQ
ncbi:hypothetical protein [Priestia megaterium]|uniref:hypothetical protein n=1 Tax=Priestia megaterium TaxID=1404 RepID=UPI000BFC7146|nr:hypothetical protein [Priestia megaterium]PGQ88252.1 hypothetical protein COA18_04815 [Priestia megaterium]